MSRYSTSKREEARRLYLTAETSSVAEIARRLKIKPHTVGVWKKEEDWEGLRLKIDRRAAEKLVEQLATERVTLNAQHYKFWGAVASRLVESLQKGDALNSETVRNLERVAAILEKLQKGQRLARGLAIDGQTEEQMRAEMFASQRHIIDLVIDVIRREVSDEATRDRVARVLLETLRETPDAEEAPL